nr:hypothetical protein [Kibdelosporangium sp. MJ126-NF4]CEL19895.1 hypothetical protein [Kibdelosporangium sp. MJ126-NF4]CTQ97119.1 hypothetical protein [Kibdelosporangium sp. MJ126-NF4]
MVPLRRVLALSGLGLLLASCGAVSGSSAAGNAETDRQSRTLADAIAYPRQENAAGFARAALATNLGKTSSFTVLEAIDLTHAGPQDPMARLVWRIHHDAVDNPGITSPAIDACYSVAFNYYEASAGPDRVTCPENAVPYVPPPLPRRDIPQDFAPALEATLGKLPASPSDADVQAALAAGLPQPPVDSQTGLAGIPPQVFVHVKGADVGVALFARTGADSKDCMMGRRLGGEVKVWSLNHRDLSMLEKSCSGEAALTP